MSEHPLVTLAASMRTALATPIAATDQAAQTARLDIIDMIPDLQLHLIGEQAMIRNMTWSVDPALPIIYRLKTNQILSASKSRYPANHKPLPNRAACASGLFYLLHRPLSTIFRPGAISKTTASTRYD
jgi:hypothetical protein